MGWVVVIASKGSPPYMSSICILAIQIEELHIFLICPHHHHRHPFCANFREFFSEQIFLGWNFPLFATLPSSHHCDEFHWLTMDILIDGGLANKQNVFVQITKCICSNYKMYLPKLQNVFVQIITKCICSNYKIYLSKLQNVFIKIDKYICQNRNSILITTGSTDWQWMFWWTMDLHKHPNVFVWTSKCIYRNQQMYLSQFTNIYFKIATLSSSQHQKSSAGWQCWF